MTPLRQKMIDEMTLRGFSPRTHEAYLSAVIGLSRHYQRSPDQIDVREVQTYLLHCLEVRGLSTSTCLQILNGLRFLYLKTLRWHSADFDLPRPKIPQRLPDILSPQDVESLFVPDDSSPFDGNKLFFVSIKPKMFGKSNFHIGTVELPNN